MYFDKPDEDERTSGKEKVHLILEVFFRGNDCIFRTSCGRDFTLARGDIQKNIFSILPVPDAISETVNESASDFTVTIHQKTHDKIMGWLKLQQELSAPDTSPDKKSFPYLRLSICLVTSLGLLIILTWGPKPITGTLLLILMLILFLIGFGSGLSLLVEKIPPR